MFTDKSAEEIQKLKKFLESRRVIDNNGCWIWTGATNTYGYGRINFNGRFVGVHRVSLKVYKPSEFIEDLGTLHKCDVRNCFNPEHLYCGSQSDNLLQCVIDGRHQTANKTHCVNGHEFSAENSSFVNGKRRCKVCHRDAERQRYQDKYL